MVNLHKNIFMHYSVTLKKIVKKKEVFKCIDSIIVITHSAVPQVLFKCFTYSKPFNTKWQPCKVVSTTPLLLLVTLAPPFAF